MVINFLTVFFIVIWILLVIRGFHEGILRMLFGIVSIILIYIVVLKATNPLAEYLESRENVNSWARERAEAYVESKEKDSKKKNHTTEVGTDYISLAPAFREAMVDELEKIKGEVHNVSEVSKQKVREAFVNTISGFIIKGIAAFIVIIACLVLVVILRIVIAIVGSLPIIHGTSKFLGGIMGAVEGLLLIWIILFLIQCFSATNAGSVLAKQAEESVFIQKLDENNFLTNFF